MEFRGKIADDWRDSEPWWPPVPTPPDGAPNVLLIVLDDVGFAQLGCYGSDIDTPRIDGLAADGIRLGNFHTTALCSPTRACLITGRNHHRSGMGRVADLASGFPGYWGRPPRENGFLSEILRANGYATYAVGKWHLSPEDETNMAGSRSTWPLARGFDRWYGFHGGETHQFVPALYHDNHAVRPPRRVEDGYHLSADLADRAIEYLADLRAVEDEQPFFLYFCTGACHSPHHAPAEWIERYRGRFAQGWDAWREETFARQLELGVVPAGTVLSPGRPGSRPGRASTTPARSWGNGSWNASPRSSPTPTRRSDGYSTSSTTWGTRTAPWSSSSPTTAPAPKAGGTGPSTKVACPTSRVPPWTRCSAASTRSAARSATTTTRGAGPWPATRPSSGGSARCTRGASPTRASSDCPPTGGPVPVVACAGSSRTRSTSCRPSWSWSAWTRRR